MEYSSAKRGSGEDLRWRQPMWATFADIVREQPQKEIVVHEGKRYCYSEVMQRAAALAAYLQSEGIATGDVVSYQLPNWIETLIIFLACCRIGAVANPIVPFYRQREVGHIVNEARSKLIFLPIAYRGFDYKAMIESIGTKAKLLFIDSQGGNFTLDDGQINWSPDQDNPGIETVNLDADALLLYTSGTESAPKGVRHSQRTLLNECKSVMRTAQVSGEDVIFLASPLTHITGIIYGHLLPFLLGSRLCLLDQWSPGAAATLIETEKCTWTTGATPFLQGLVYDSEAKKRNLSSLRLFRCGGADVPPKLIRDAREMGIDAYRTYGSSEHPTVTGVSGCSPQKAATTDGLVHPSVQVRIASMGDGELEQQPHETGEIQTKGPEVFLGYKNPALNTDAFTQTGWFRTGDIGFLDPDGYLTVVGRKKDIVIRKGENISTKEIEDLLNESQLIKEVAVIGIPDEQRGEMIVAVCVPASTVPLSLKHIIEHLKQYGMAKQKYPERLEIIEELPKTAAGKIRKNILRSQFRQAALNQESDPS